MMFFSMLRLMTGECFLLAEKKRINLFLKINVDCKALKRIFGYGIANKSVPNIYEKEYNISVYQWFRRMV